MTINRMDLKENKNSYKSYHQILKSTVIIGGSSAIVIILRIIRTKFLAVLLGPSGMGLFGIYGSITEMVQTIARMGIDSSGVKQIAEAGCTGDQEKIARTVFALRRTSFFLGVLGAILFVILSFPICKFTFGNNKHSSEVIFLCLTIFFGTISGGQLALIQGMRKIGDLAKISVYNGLLGTIFSILIIYVLGQRGIVPFIIVASVIDILNSWWYSRKIKLPNIHMRWMEIQNEVKPLLKLGSVIMVSALMTTVSLYLVRVIVARHLSIEAVGLYQAATALSSIYVGFILDSMIKDYYPRLTAISNDNYACNQLVNEQVEVGFLLSAPGILATFTFAPIILQIFYSAKFMAAFEILRWQVLGILLRIWSWPMGFILLAKGKSKIFFWTEFLANAIHVGLIWTGITFFGLSGTGMAFFGMYVFYWILIHCIVRHLTGLTWSPANVRITSMVLLAVGIVFLGNIFLKDVYSLILACTITVMVGLYSIKRLVAIISLEGVSHILLTIRNRFYNAIDLKNVRQK